MSITITKLKMWKNPGYTRGCLDVPPAGSKRLPAPDWTNITNLRPRKSETISAIELPLSFCQVFDMSYLYIEASDGNTPANTIKVFGWIDSVEQTASSDEAVLIRWTVDWWRTYSGSVTFGFGMVRRRPRGTNDPIQKVPYRYKIPGDNVDVIPNTIVGAESNWCIISYVEKDNQTPPQVTAIKTCCFPVSKDNPTEKKYVMGNESPNIKDVIIGDVSSALGISPSSIVSAFISPLPPYLLKAGTGTSVSPYTVDTVPVPVQVTHTLNYTGTYIIGMYLDNNGVFRYYQYANGTTGLASLIPKYTQGGNTCSGRKTELVFKYNGNTVSSMMWMTPSLLNTLFVTSNGYTPSNGDTLVLSDVYTVPRANTDSGYPFETDTGSDPKVFTVSLSGGTFRSLLTLTHDGTKWVNPYDADPTNPGLIVKVDDHFDTVNYTTTEMYDSSEIVYSNGVLRSETQQFVEYQNSTDLITTDTQEWVITDMTGHNVGSLPWGIRLTDYTIRTVVTSTSAYLQIRGRGLDSSLMGLEFTIPLQPIDITSNSWSEYVYSGQREYDVQQRKIANERSFEDAIMGTVGNTVSNTIFGALSGKGAVAMVSGVSTAVSGIMTANMERDRTSQWNDRLQEQDDMLRAKQIDNIMIPGGGWDWLWHGRELKFVSISPDPYSASLFVDHVDTEGITVSEATANCTSLVSAGGTLQIDSLTVTGSVPPQAKQNIKDLLSRGIRMIEMNPSGVTP